MAAILYKPDARILAILQGAYWLVTGVWPFIHLYSFIWITGPKQDIWLLYTVSVLIIAIGGVLMLAGIRKNVSHEIRWLGISGALGLTGIDVYYALNDVIRDIYLLDALAEILLVILWLWAGNKGISKRVPN